MKNLLLRGTVLKNTQYCYGICIYVGLETKIFKNATKPLRKISGVMRLMNKLLYSVFFAQMLIIIGFSSASLVWIEEHQVKLKYLHLEGSVGVGRWIV
jgi:magnesium-transporting ATPase (P-type)